jgi:hypothetical protein
VIEIAYPSETHFDLQRDCEIGIGLESDRGSRFGSDFDFGFGFCSGCGFCCGFASARATVIYAIQSQMRLLGSVIARATCAMSFGTRRETATAIGERLTVRRRTVACR